MESTLVVGNTNHLNVCICMISFNLYKNSMRSVQLLLLHFTDKKTEAKKQMAYGVHTATLVTVPFSRSNINDLIWEFKGSWIGQILSLSFLLTLKWVGLLLTFQCSPTLFSSVLTGFLWSDQPNLFPTLGFYTWKKPFNQENIFSLNSTLNKFPKICM